MIGYVKIDIVKQDPSSSDLAKIEIVRESDNAVAITASGFSQNSEGVYGLASTLKVIGEAMLASLNGGTMQEDKPTGELHDFDPHAATNGEHHSPEAHIPFNPKPRCN